MTKYRLNRDVEVIFQRMHTVRAKAGTPVNLQRTHFSIHPSLVETDSTTGPNTIWAHDTKYYHIWAPIEAVEERSA